ncbi:class I adenylate-forming enzyme family protein [Nonomuraea sp. NPDC050328]|uniref:class I adenylate-forming enzyme family protein n=1 Tax=Nonomuraea sp. NPDC050328 TaxID=3364361 RepID=UPI0037A346C0
MFPTIPELLAARARSEPDRVALIVQAAGRSSPEASGRPAGSAEAAGQPSGSSERGRVAAELTFGAWADGAARVAAGLAARGVRRGDRVGLLFPAAEWTDYAVAFCGVLQAGAVAVPLSDRATAQDRAHVLADCTATCLVHGTEPTPSKDTGAATGWAGRQWGLGEVMTGPPTGAGEAAAGPGGPSPDPAMAGVGGLPAVRPQDPAQILYTSGTTGRPKGVLATHANLAYGLGGRRRPFAHSKHLVHAFPIGTNAAQTMLLTAIDAAPAVVTLPHFTPGRFAALIESYRAGTVFLVPAMAIELLNAGAHERHDLSSVLLLGSAAAPLPGPVAQRLATAFPKAAITNYYTSTEAAPAQTIMMVDPDRPGSVGRAVAGGSVRICGQDGTPLPPGETGEVWMRSPAAPRAYYGDPASDVFRDGWVRMGDLGYLDEEGYLYLVDRESDVVKSGAFKVSTLRVEEAVYAHPAVAEAAVLGVPHPVLGRALTAVIVTRAPLSAEELRLFLRDRLAPHEVPAQVHTVDALPRNRGGKVDKRQLMGAFK